jgi:hypothetical protein
MRFIYCVVKMVASAFSSGSMCSPDSYRDAYCGSKYLRGLF